MLYKTGMKTRYSPLLMTHPRRPAPFSEHTVHLLDFMGIGYNFGHFLIDHMLPALGALAAYNLMHLVDSAQVVLFTATKVLVLTGFTSTKVLIRTGGRLQAEEFPDIFHHVTRQKAQILTRLLVQKYKN